MAKSPNNTVVVGCKLPHGIILTVDGVSVELNGTNTSDIIGGYGLTENVDADFFGEWCKRNFQHPALGGGFIFAQGTTVEARAQARDNAANANGFEGINPSKPGMGVQPVPVA